MVILKINRRDMFYGAKADLFNLAAKMRKHPTDGEDAMWKMLKRFRRAGFTFRRQHPIEFYIADFYCHKLKLVIEVDGEIHSLEEVHSHDEARSGELERFGIKVLRFTNDQVLYEEEFVLNQIQTIIKESENTKNHYSGKSL